MTLIATTLNYRRPVIISDTLASSENVRNPIALPGVTNGYEREFPADKQFLPVALRQKMYIVNDNICIVFATDNSNEVQVFLALFKEYFPEGSALSNDRIHQFLKAYGLEHYFNNSSFLIFYFEKDGNERLNVNQFYLPCSTYLVDTQKFTTEDDKWNILKEPVYEESWAHASGASKFLNLVNQQALSAQSQFPIGEMMRAIQMNTILVARLHALQTVAFDHYCLANDWGGAFEIAYYTGEKFEKLTEYAYVICHGQFDHDGDIGVPRPMYVLYYRYVKDVLAVMELSGPFGISENEDFIVFTSEFPNYYVRVFDILTIDAREINKSQGRTVDLSFSTEIVAVGYALITKGNGIFNPAFFNYGPAVKVVFRQGKSLKIYIHKKIGESIREQSKANYGGLIL